MLSMNINKLHKEVEERENRKFKTFEKVLDLCYQKILAHNQSNNNYSCTYLVPNMVFGLPLYDVGECCSYIIEKLIEKGFDIYLAQPTTLHISWLPKSMKDKKQKQLQQQQYIQNQYMQPQYPAIAYGNGYDNGKQPSRKTLDYDLEYDGSIISNNHGRDGRDGYHNSKASNSNNDLLPRREVNELNELKKLRDRQEKQQKQKKNYRPINDYNSTENNTIYNDEDLELFTSKLDKLF